VILHASIHKPCPHARAELVESMQRFGEALRRQPGLRFVGTFETEGGELVGLALWESREAFERGRTAGSKAVAGDPFDKWESAAVIGYVGLDVGVDTARDQVVTRNDEIAGETGDRRQ
jgi:heme-degrading monooxygenase HmoA